MFLFQRFQNIMLYCISLSSVYLYYIFHINSIHVKQNRAPTLSIPFLDYSSQPSAPYPPQQRAQKAKKLTQGFDKQKILIRPSFFFLFFSFPLLTPQKSVTYANLITMCQSEMTKLNLTFFSHFPYMISNILISGSSAAAEVLELKIIS